MNKNNYEKYIDFYKVTRASIEHFDKILGDFRKIIFTLDGVLVGAGVTYYIHSNPKPSLVIMMYANFAFAVANFLVWQLEKHYHRYLTMSSKIARKMEGFIFDRPEELDIALTYQLKEARNSIFGDNGDKRIPWPLRRLLYKISRYIRTYDFLYIIPIISSAGLNFFLVYLMKENAAQLSMTPEILMRYRYSAFLLCGIYIIGGYYIIRSMYWFVKYYNGTDFSNTNTQVRSIFNDKNKAEICRIARSIYEKRIKINQAGDSTSDWLKAESIYRNSRKYLWWKTKRLIDGKYSPNREYI